MTITEQYLRAYDQQLRTDAETPSAIDVTLEGPLRLVTFDGGRGFITYQDLGGADAGEIAVLVATAIAHFQADARITEVEWKTRGHDHAPGLHEALLANGFTPDEAESIMVGPLEGLARAVPLPDGVSLRKVFSDADVRAMSVMADEAFGGPASPRQADSLMARLARNDGMELWVAESQGQMVSAGRLEPVPNSDFAGIWGGATLKEFRGRGIYRALTAARAHSALAAGKLLAHSDSTEDSRPILERSGLLKVSTTTPYRWKR
ncbi:GNAT family N-acetyltransferase [Arthrobacter psychrochitiniphilus]|uniref:GNAT family N-acetyltransferase n=1 Tax=Arthrobacter psychrochitiniphilus TaxID=291045 RepID=A0A2V3DPQ4_9MICC|nr:GNAT family N-acetyltransferase [Arthrobacter psychrochitiniphilus]NYG18101.1 ribosomal protein S18 acetylase RimI-like enzyme [Arthrobacter psychrochitiniphilus]PXA64184.1 GNAT family N-acetyltransferase [Arthrobacter psychrochitiniphilus]